MKDAIKRRDSHWLVDVSLQNTYLCILYAKYIKNSQKLKKKKHQMTQYKKKVWTDISAKKLHKYNELYEYMNINKLNQLYEHKAAQHYYPQGNAN